MTLEQRSTDWQIQDSNTTDWRGETRAPSDVIPASLETTTDWVEDIRGDAGDNVAVHDVTSVFGRTGDVVALLGDYESGLVGIVPPLSPERPYGTVRLYLQNLSSDVDEAILASQSASNDASAALTAAEDALDTANAAIPLVQKAAANGVASLGSDGKVPVEQLPPAGGLTMPLTVDVTVQKSAPSLFLQNTAVGLATRLVRASDNTFSSLIHSSDSGATQINIVPVAETAPTTSTINFWGSAGSSNVNRVFQWTNFAGSTAASFTLNTAGDGLNWTGKQDFAGAVTVAADPVVALGVATKAYVDAHSGGASITVAPTAPASSTAGALWWNSTDGNMYIFYDDGTSSAWVAAMVVPVPAAIPVAVGVWYPGVPTASVVLLQFVSPDPWTLPSGLGGSQGFAGTAATASTTINLQKNGTNQGTVVFAAGGTVATFVLASSLSFASGDRLTLLAPASPDATLKDVSITLKGSR